MDLRELIHKRNALWDRYQELLRHVSDSGLTAADKGRLDQYETELESLSQAIERLEYGEKLSARFNTVEPLPSYGGEQRAYPPSAPGQTIAPHGVHGSDSSRVHPHIRGAAMNTEHDQAFRAYLRTGEDRDQRAQGVGTGSAGGWLVPASFRAKLIETMVGFGGVRSVAETIVTDSGADLPFPTVNDTAAAGAILAENTQVTEQDVTFATKTLRAYVYTSRMVRVSLQLLQDSAFDLEAWLARALGTRIARGQAPHFVTGTGTGQPQGIVTGATVGVVAATGGTTTVTYDNLVDLQHSVDPEYRQGDGVAWLMNDSTFSAIRRLKDSTNRPLVEPNVQSGTPNTLLGYPVVVDNAMPPMAASAKSILFGNLKAGYVIRDVGDVQVLRLVERYADYLQHGVLGYQRADGLVQDSAAYKAFQNAAA